MKAVKRILLGITFLVFLSISTEADTHPAESADAAVSIEPATFDVRLVQIDLSAIAESEGAGNSKVGMSESWGFSFGLSITDGKPRFKPPVFFLGDNGELRIGQQVWHLGAALDDAERGIARPGSPFRVLSSPQVRCLEGETAVISVGSAVEYLIRDEGGCLRPADASRDPVETEGVVIRLTPTLISEEAVEFDPVEVRLRRVLRREAIEGVPLDVGQPVMHEDHLECDFRMVKGRVAVMLLSRMHEETDGPIFVVVSRSN